MGILALDEADRVVEWQEKPKQPKSDLASMGVYVFSKKALRRWLTEERADFGAQCHPGDDRWRRPRLRLSLRAATGRTSGRSSRTGRRTWPSSTTGPSSTCTTRSGSSTPSPRSALRRRSARPPRSTGASSATAASSTGRSSTRSCRPASGSSVGAVVRDSIVMFDTVIRSGAVVDRAILDKEVVVGPGRDRRRRRRRHDRTASEPGRLNTGITVVGKRTVIPRGARIGRNVRIADDVRATDFIARGRPERRIGRPAAPVTAARHDTRAARDAAPPGPPRRPAGRDGRRTKG